MRDSVGAVHLNRPDSADLSANENQDARYQRKNSRHNPGNANVKERGDSDENQVSREQEHSNVFGDHGLLLRT